MPSSHSVRLRACRAFQGPDAGVVVEGAWKLGVETDIGALGGVVPLAEVDESGIGKDIAKVKGVAPARMSEDDIRPEALFLELKIDPRCGLADTDGVVIGRR